MRTIYAGVSLIFAAACATVGNNPPAPAPAVNTGEISSGSDRAADSLLVELTMVDPTFVIDMRYATDNNFTGAKLPGYEANRAYLRREAASALERAQKKLAARGLGLKIFDAYRPVRATEEMVRWTNRVSRQDLIADGYIASRSRHNLGVAIDLTIVELSTGRELDMGTPFDTFSRAAHSANATGVVAENRMLLQAVMQASGFAPYSEEWWHFSFPVEKPLRFDKVIR